MARDKLHISEACVLLLPHHILLDHAREDARGKGGPGHNRAAASVLPTRTRWQGGRCG